VLVRPACRHPTAALPRSTLFLPHPAVDHRAPLPPGPTSQPRPAALPCSPARLRRERALPPPTAPPGAIPIPRSGCRPHATPSFSLSPSVVWHARADPPPPISLSRSPPRARHLEEATGASLCSVPRPSSPLPPSPPPTCPPRRLPPPETPPPLRFPFECHRLRHFMVRPIRHRCPHLRLPSPSLFRTNTAGSCLHHHRPPELSPR
jgi:hypothetical protein